MKHNNLNVMCPLSTSQPLSFPFVHALFSPTSLNHHSSLSICLSSSPFLHLLSSSYIPASFSPLLCSLFSSVSWRNSSPTNHRSKRTLSPNCLLLIGPSPLRSADSLKVTLLLSSLSVERALIRFPSTSSEWRDTFILCD